MPVGRSIQLGRVFGIRIGVNPSWFVVLFLFIWWLTGYYQDIPGNGNTLGFVLATASALLFFSSILLHELGHALVAIRNRIPIAGIDLWLFGGIAKMTRDSDSPGAEFRIAAAGPLVTLLIAGACAAIALIIGGSDELSSAMRFKSLEISNNLVAVFGYLTTINLFLFGFNLIPAFPLDGGRIARSIAWWRTGDRTRATRFAAMLGRFFSYVLIGYGIFVVLYWSDLIGGLWFAFIGMFLGQAARDESYRTAVLSSIEGVKVADVMDAEPVVVSGDASVEQALDEYFLRYRWPWFPVVDGHGYFIGLVERERAEQVAEQNRPVFTVREIMRPYEKSWRVSLDDPLEALLGSEPLGRIGALVAVDAEGRLRGVVTIDQVRRALQQGVS